MSLHALCLYASTGIRGSSNMQAVLGKLPYQDIKFKGGVDYLLVVLKDSVSQQDFQSFKPNYVQLLSLAPDSTVRGVIVSKQGGVASHVVPASVS